MAHGSEHPDYSHLPEPVDPSTLSIEIPAFEDDRPQPEPLPPAASPELVAATQVAQGGGASRTHRTQLRAALFIGVGSLGLIGAIAAIEILLAH